MVVAVMVTVSMVMTVSVVIVVVRVIVSHSPKYTAETASQS
jgi:hypothetical protein